MKKQRHQYHPCIPLLFYLSQLPADLLQQIPKSTRYDWRHKKQTSLFGYECSVQQEQLVKTLCLLAANKKLLAANKALLKVIALKNFIAQYLKKGKSAGTSTVIVHTIKQLKPVLSFKKALKFSGLSYAKWFTLSRRLVCFNSPLGLCRRKHFSQLLRAECDTIVSLCTNKSFEAWPLASIYHYALRNNLLYCSLASFYKYAFLLVTRQPLPAHRRKNHTTGIRANLPLAIVHADITQFTTLDHTKHFIYFIQDNFSRAIVQYKIACERKASILLELIRNACLQHTDGSYTNQRILLTDDGCENKPIVKNLYIDDADVHLTHLIAQKSISFSNSMIEYLNKTIKYRYLYQQPIVDFVGLQTILDFAVCDYNNRPANCLNGLTPLEALAGSSFNPSFRKERIKQAGIKRKAINLADNCCFIAR